MKTIYNFSVQDAELQDIPLKDYKDKVLLVVNVASYCGLTYQYESLEKLYKKYQNKDFEILGFPCNQFAFQEPGNNKDITKIGINFLKERYPDSEIVISAQHRLEQFYCDLGFASRGEVYLEDDIDHIQMFL